MVSGSELRLRVKGTGFRVQSVGFRVKSLGYSVCASRFRVSFLVVCRAVCGFCFPGPRERCV